MKVSLYIAMISLSINIYSFDFENAQSLNHDKINVPSVNISVEELDEEFDPHLPTTPPPESINIIRSSEFDDINEFDDIKKSVIKKSVDEFDISDINQIKYLDLVIKNTKEQNFDVELTLAIIKAESGFNPKARSSKGAIGLMQLLPATAKWLGLKNTSKLTDPDINIKYGIKYMRYLLNEFAKDVDSSEIKKDDIQKQEVLKAIAAYNAGPGIVKKYDKPPYNGIPPFRETRDYVKKVPYYFIKFKDFCIKK